MVVSGKKGKSMFLIEIRVAELEHADDINAVLREAEEKGELDFPFAVKEAVSADGIYRWNAKEVK